MKNISLARKLALGLGALVLVVAIGSPAGALDAYQDRSGFFSGVGLGGGGAFQGGDPGGALLLDFQLGGGASKNLTLDLDLDLCFQLMDKHRNFLITPGPEINYFFGETGIFIRGGIGMALVFTWFDDPKEDIPAGGKEPENNDFNIGFDASIGVGWEFFANSNLAVGLAVEADYVVLKGDDIIGVGFSIGLKYY
ncbi:MAG: hypothetical protein GY854_10395 [Deltaproteobacteria bacterium]|nr:hypothetical protein [Deltaproteobacteria bacterium]